MSRTRSSSFWSLRPGLGEKFFQFFGMIDSSHALEGLCRRTQKPSVSCKPVTCFRQYLSVDSSLIPSRAGRGVVQFADSCKLCVTNTTVGLLDFGWSPFAVTAALACRAGRTIGLPILTVFLSPAI